MEDSSALDKLLDTIDASGGPSGADCANNAYQDVPVRLPTHIFDSLVQKIELVSRVLEGYFSHHDQSKFVTHVSFLTIPRSEFFNAISKMPIATKSF